MKKLELLSPAGDMERLEMAIAYGADAVYLAGEHFGMRSFAGNFDKENLIKASKLCKQTGVALHVTCNTMPRNEEVEQLPQYLEFLNELDIKALIMGDIGVLNMAKKYAPKLEIHVSTQASIVNYESAMAYYNLGAKRVILARELSLKEIELICQRKPKDLEIEVFGHGAMCVSYSGRCLLSNYMTGRDANRGACAQPCRYQYDIVEEKRPGEYFSVIEDDRGTHIMNSKDLCMIDHVSDLLEVGVDSLKIEGRAKSAYYTAVVTGAYRHAIDCAMRSEPLEHVWRDEVYKVSHRHYSTGFFYGQPGQHTDHSRYVREWQVVAIVESCTQDGMAVLSLRNKFQQGDKVEVIGPNVAALEFEAPMMYTEKGTTIDVVKTPQMKFQMQLPKAVPRLSMLRIARAHA